MSLIKVSAVSYLNTKPFLVGFQHHSISTAINLRTQTPAEIAMQLVSGNTTIGLVPIAAVKDIAGAQIISDFCIACDGAVGSVCICSNVPLEEVESIYLDYQSRTSVELAKMLIHDYWNLHPVLIHSKPGYESAIQGNTAGLIIGDRCLSLKKKFNYCYDLGAAWKNYTGLPFVFAVWVSNKSLAPELLQSFNMALNNGLQTIPEVAKQSELLYPGIDVADYLTNKIHYRISPAMREGMELFLQKLEDLLPASEVKAK